MPFHSGTQSLYLGEGFLDTVLSKPMEAQRPEFTENFHGNRFTGTQQPDIRWGATRPFSGMPDPFPNGLESY
jgi:hypothetical protein